MNTALSWWRGWLTELESGQLVYANYLGCDGQRLPTWQPKIAAAAAAAAQNSCSRPEPFSSQKKTKIPRVIPLFARPGKDCRRCEGRHWAQAHAHVVVSSGAEMRLRFLDGGVQAHFAVIF